MNLQHVVEALNCEVVCGDPSAVDVRQGLSCDLLSEVMAAAGKADLWITVQSHSNIVAVSVIVGIKCILLANGRDYNGDTIEKAKQEKVVLLKCNCGAFELSGRIYEMLQR